MAKIQGVVEWLNRIVVAERPAESVVAFNVGLFETDGGYCAYLTGATRFDPLDSDWACEEAFTPAERYLLLSRDEVGPSDPALLQEQVVKEVERFLGSPAAGDSFFSSAQAVTVGFDDGELVRIR